MHKVRHRKNNREKRKLRVRKKVFGTADKPRFSVYRSNEYIYAQLIDDEVGNTLVSATDNTEKLRGKDATRMEKAFEAGKNLAKKAKKAGIEQVVFDRNGYRYHGRVKQVAEGAREGGLKF